MKVPYSSEEKLAWDIYFASLCAMSMHPGNRKDTSMSLAQIAETCDWMVQERQRRFQQCQHGSSAEQS